MPLVNEKLPEKVAAFPRAIPPEETRFSVKSENEFVVPGVVWSK